MQSTDWNRYALDSEIAYSKALQSSPIEYPNFIHMHNVVVPWNGDFNRAVGCKLSGFQSFEDIISQVESLHQTKKLVRPNRYDIYAPSLKEEIWYPYLSEKGYSLETAIFFCAPTASASLPSGYILKCPSEPEYIDWFCNRAHSWGFYSEQWFETIRPLQLHFIRVFKPYWLMREGTLVGWVYAANLGKYARLFEVEIRPEFRGQGLGQILLRVIRVEGIRLGVAFILLQAGERLRNFYEKAGFRECARNSIIWLQA